MDILLMVVVIVGLIIRSKGRKKGSKNHEQLGSVLAGISAFLLIILFFSDCMRAMP